MKAGRNDSCPCGSGEKYKKCCWGNDSQSVQTVKEIFNPKYNRYETPTSHRYNQGYYNGATFKREKEHKARVKCKLLHSNGFSVIVPEFIIMETGWIQPLHILAPRLFKGEDEIICDINADISGEQSLQIRISSQGFLTAFDDGSQLFECSISGPEDLEQYCGGAYKEIDSRILFKMYHHTGKEGAKGIRTSKQLWASEWNYRGTEKKCINFNHIYFTHIPELKYDNDLSTVAMSKKGTLTYATDKLPAEAFLKKNISGYEDQIYTAEVYRESSRKRTDVLSFWVDITMIDGKHIYYHDQDGSVFYELCFPYIHRVKTIPKAKIEFDEGFVLQKTEDIRTADYNIIGDCTTLDGLKAPFDEENTEYMFTIDNCDGINILEYWFQNGNKPLFFPENIDLMKIK